MHLRTALALQATRRTINPSSSNLLRTSLADPFVRPGRALSLASPRYRPSPISIPMAAGSDSQATQISSTADTAIDAEHLTKKLQAAMQTTHVSIEDMSGGCGQAFNAIIVSPEFEKKTLLARSRLVNSVLKEEISAIHAWTPRCLTPEQWEKEKQRIG